MSFDINIDIDSIYSLLIFDRTTDWIITELNIQIVILEPWIHKIDSLPKNNMFKIAILNIEWMTINAAYLWWIHYLQQITISLIELFKMNTISGFQLFTLQWMHISIYMIYSKSDQLDKMRMINEGIISKYLTQC